MGRDKSDFTKVSNKKGEKQKDEILADILKAHKELAVPGWYKGCFLKLKRKDDSLISNADIFGLEDDIYYGTANGFLPISYSDGDITAEFMEALDNPSKFSDVIGKEVKVYIDFTEGKDEVTYPNIYGYEKL